MWALLWPVRQNWTPALSDNLIKFRMKFLLHMLKFGEVQDEPGKRMGCGLGSSRKKVTHHGY